MSKTFRVFLYDHLMNSLKTEGSFPGYSITFPATLFGFTRVFNVEDGGISRLNLEKDEINQSVNGLCIDVSESVFQDYLEGNLGLEMVEVEVKHFEKDEVSKALFFRVPKDTAFPFQHTAQQERYLQLCLDACQEFGNDFVTEFKKTTFLDESTTLEHQERQG